MKTAPAAGEPYAEEYHEYYIMVKGNRLLEIEDGAQVGTRSTSAHHR